MKAFRLRRQTVATSRVGAPTLCQWLEAKTDDIRIVIDGSKTENSLRITVEANGIRYMLTDSMLEMILGEVAERYSTEFIGFNMYQVDADGKIT
jgi:hypothetical protein